MRTPAFSISDISTGNRRQPRLLLALTLLLLSGCTSNAHLKDSGPGGFAATALPIPHIPPSDAPLHNIKLSVQFDWWRLLHSPTLNTLLERGFATHPSVDSAQAALLEIQRSDLAHSGYFHHVADVRTLTTAQETPAATEVATLPAQAKFIGAAYYNLPLWQLETGYTPEVFRPGPATTPRKERELQLLQLEATYRTLAANIIACALQEASLRAEMPALRKIAAIDQNLLAIARKQLKAQLVSPALLDERASAAAYSERSLLLLKQQFEQTRARLHVLLGLAQEQALPEVLDLGALHLNEEPPRSLPGASIARRPDMRAAQLQVGHQDQAIANGALQDMEKTLRAAHGASAAFNAAVTSRRQHVALLDNVKADYARNPASYQNRLLAERNVQLAELQLAQTHATHIGDIAALYHALGGAWWDMESSIALRTSNRLQAR